jgi:predicted component of type VI protein secretion system
MSNQISFNRYTLLDKLTDDYPKAIIENPNTIFYSKNILSTFIRDITNLLNSHSKKDFQKYKRVDESALNYGIKLFTGRYQKTNELADAIYETLIRYEPRFAPGTLNVESKPSRFPGCLSYIIAGNVNFCTKSVQINLSINMEEEKVYAK